MRFSPCLVVLCTKHAGKSSDSFVGWAIHWDGPQIKAAHVVTFSTDLGFVLQLNVDI